MNEDVAKWFANSQSLPEAWINANQLWAHSLEKLTALQMKSLQSYVEFGLSQCKAAARVSDIKSLTDFCTNQNETANTLRQRVMDDAKALADLGVDFKVGLENFAKECASTMKAAA